jgi:hypothetical protein
MATAERSIPLAEAAHALGLTWAQAWRLVLVGALDGRKEGARWIVTQESTEAYGARRRAAAAAAS